MTPEERNQRAQYIRDWKAANPERMGAYAKQNKEWLKKKLQEEPAYQARKMRFHRTRWTQEEVDRAIEEQNNKCAVCEVEMTRGSSLRTDMCADHDHETKQPRGLLCRACNSVEGWLTGHHEKDWSRLVKRMIKYLARFNEPRCS